MSTLVSKCKAPQQSQRHTIMY